VPNDCFQVVSRLLSPEFWWQNDSGLGRMQRQRNEDYGVRIGTGPDSKNANNQIAEETPMENQPNIDFAAMPNKALKVITNPVGFYREMPTTGGFVEPLVFLVIMSVISAVLQVILHLVGFGMAGAMFAGFIAIILVPIVAAVFSFIGAGIMFVIWMIMGSKENYETAYRCVAYATAIYPVVTILHIIPYVGGIVAALWGMYLMATASIEVHKIKTNVAYIVFGILALILVIMNISGEYTSRHFAARMDQMSHNLENMDKMSPEEAGKAVGDFLKGMQKSQQQQQNGGSSNGQ
jgi:hypothetical protein